MTGKSFDHCADLKLATRSRPVGSLCSSNARKRAPDSEKQCQPPSRSQDDVYREQTRTLHVHKTENSAKFPRQTTPTDDVRDGPIKKR